MSKLSDHLNEAITDKDTFVLSQVIGMLDLGVGDGKFEWTPKGIKATKGKLSIDITKKGNEAIISIVKGKNKDTSTVAFTERDMINHIGTKMKEYGLKIMRMPEYGLF